jgi:arginase
MKSCSIIGYASGAGGRIAGAERGPEALRALGLASRLEALGWSVVDLGDVGHISADQTAAETTGLSADDLLANRAEKVLADCRALSLKVASVATESLPVVLGGDHSLSVGTMAGLSVLSEQKKLPLGVLWVDAHPDLLTAQESVTRNLHGMTVASILGSFPGAFERLSRNASRPQPSQVAYVGLRDVEPAEKARLRDLKIPAFSMSDIDRRGLGAVLEDALRVVTTGTAGFLLSFDLDVCDPELVPGTGVKMRGGLNFREAHLVMEMAWASGQMRALEMVELNPLLDVDNRTAELAVSLIESGLGRTIL